MSGQENITLGESLPSLPVAVIDVPEVTNFETEFTYNFFAPDELTNESITTTSQGNTVGFLRSIPRYVRLSWNKVAVGSSGRVKKEFVDISIEKNAAKVTDEENLHLKYYQPIEQQEVSFVARTQSYLSHLYNQTGYNSGNASLTDVCRALNEATGETVTQEFLNRFLNYSNSSNITTDISVYNPASDAEKINTVMPVSNKIYGTLLHEKLMADSLTPMDTVLVDHLDSQFATQASVAAYNNRFNGSQYELDLTDAVTSTVSEATTDFGTVYETTGYIIQRFTLMPDGSFSNPRTFYIENPDTVEFFDTQVAYNKHYIYSIKAVVAVQTLSFNQQQRVNVVSTFLIASKKTRSVVFCKDVSISGTPNPPPPPTDFVVTWDYSLKKPVLTWNYPNDTRRHIKYFQVFRRKNVGDIRPAQKPFELVCMYAFNDLQGANGLYYTTVNNTFVFSHGENNINPAVIVDLTNNSRTTSATPTCYIDEDFNKNDYYIYSVAAVDAHGISSNYSNQIGIVYNRPKNTIDVVAVSAPGAPKPYPNLYIDKDAFVDTIKNEGYSQATIVFNPDCYGLYTHTGENLNLLTFGPDNFYRLQLINIDLQTDQFIDIKISDDRTRG
jgi:hypothetical protein